MCVCVCVCNNLINNDKKKIEIREVGKEESESFNIYIIVLKRYVYCNK